MKKNKQKTARHTRSPYSPFSLRSSYSLSYTNKKKNQTKPSNLQTHVGETYVSPTDLLKALSLYDSTQITLNETLQVLGCSSLFVDEFVTAIMRVNYGQVRCAEHIESMRWAMEIQKAKARTGSIVSSVETHIVCG